MTDFLDFLDAHRGGLLILAVFLVFLAFLVQWFAWIFSVGRFSPANARRPSQTLRYVFSEAAIKIINDFRHLLALVIVSIFAVALLWAMIQGRTSIGDMKEGLQAVVATLGGLVGSIIGYYFGESTVARPQDTGPTSDAAGSGAPPVAIQGQGQPPPITPAPVPPEPTQAGGVQNEPNETTREE